MLTEDGVFYFVMRTRGLLGSRGAYPLYAFPCLFAAYTLFVLTRAGARVFATAHFGWVVPFVLAALLGFGFDGTRIRSRDPLKRNVSLNHLT